MTKEFPKEEIFFENLRKHESECETKTIEKLHSLGKKAILTYKCLGTLQSYLYRYACCDWGCKTKDHKLEYTIGRVVGHCQASLRVLFFGYYDESLALTRNISEIANLLALFSSDSNEFENWKTFDDTNAWQEYNPSKVRKKIKNLNGFAPIEKEHYARLCSLGTHINPLTTPQNFNPIRIPTVGAIFQELGFFVSLNELALSMTFIGGGVSKIGTINKKIKKEIINASIKLAKNTGEITTDNMNKVWEKTYNKKTFI